MDTPVLTVVGAICLAAALSWVRSARYRYRLVHRIDPEEAPDAYTLAWSQFRKDAHAVFLYGFLALGFFINSTTTAPWVFVLVVLPALISSAWARNAVREARLARQRIDIERRAHEALAQEDLAPKAWAGRLAPDDLPDFSGFEIGRVYQAGAGLMGGDFLDVFLASPTRLVAVIGDVSGHGIESSVTAFQAKYLLRTFLRQYRDPAQALEELNRQMSAVERTEEFISLVVLIFDTEAATMRYTSAGHPATFLWHQREVRSLRATGPLLMLDPNGTYFSREIPLEHDDMVLMYTDGLAEARNGDELFGEERIENAIRRDPGITPNDLCNRLLEAANDFSPAGVEDDIAILSIRKV